MRHRSGWAHPYRGMLLSDGGSVRRAMRARKAELETELRRYADAFGAGTNMPAIIQAMKVRQGGFRPTTALR